QRKAGDSERTSRRGTGLWKMTFASASMSARFTSRFRPWKRGTANRQVLRSLRERFGAEVFYAGPGEKADFAAALARGTGAPDDPLLGRLGLAHAGRDWVRLEFLEDVANELAEDLCVRCARVKEDVFDEGKAIRGKAVPILLG